MIDSFSTWTCPWEFLETVEDQQEHMRRNTVVPPAAEANDLDFDRLALTGVAMDEDDIRLASKAKATDGSFWT